MFKAVLFTIAKVGEKTRCPLMNEWINTLLPSSLFPSPSLSHAHTHTYTDIILP
jgi:hypothetical protein